MIADKIGNYKAVLMGSILATAGFHTLLLTIDAHGTTNQSHFITNTTQPLRSALVHPACDRSERTIFKFANNCFSSMCRYENLFENSTKQFKPSNCVQSCNGASRSMDLCIKTGLFNCFTYEDETFLQPTTENASVPTISPVLCEMQTKESMLKNIPQSAIVDCDCPIDCPALVNSSPWFSCQTSNGTSPPTEFYDYEKHQRGFWLYLVIRILATASLGTSFTMLDATTICLIKKYKGQLGRQRLFGVLGSATFAMSTGILLDWAASLNNGKTFQIKNSLVRCRPNKLFYFVPYLINVFT